MGAEERETCDVILTTEGKKKEDVDDDDDEDEEDEEDESRAEEEAAQTLYSILYSFSRARKHQAVTPRSAQERKKKVRKKQ